MNITMSAETEDHVELLENVSGLIENLKVSKPPVSFSFMI